MPVFYFLVILGMVLFWFIASFLFKPLGRLFRRLWDDAMEEIQEDKNNELKE